MKTDRNSRSGLFQEYLWRLKKTSPGEVLYRAQQYSLSLCLRNKHFRKRIENQFPVVDWKRIKSIRLPEFFGEITEESVEAILAGKLFTLNTPVSAIFEFEKQNRQYFNQISSLPCLDIRGVWEPARLQHITILLVWLTRNPDSSRAGNVRSFVKNRLIQWLRENPFLCGPHYQSAMECGLRIPVFVYSLIILEDLTSTQRHKLLQAIYLHAWWVYHRLSLYASLGNHTICECAGLIFSGVVFRDNAAGEKWLDRGRELLTAEAEHQILRDGGSSEQACNYHRFILDLYQLVYDFLRKNRIEPIAGIKAEFVAGEFFLEKMGDADVGDSDDGFAIAPCLAPKRVSANSKSHALTAFDTSGYSIINSDRVKLIFDHGPLGMPPLYNHGHADALSITLRVEDCPILIDPGTYRYNGVSEWRQYFKGTRAHNTVTIDGKDQAVQRTGFIWSHPYECTSIESRKYGGDISLVACHDGYRRLREPVRHFRRIKFFYPNYLVISDWFRGKGTHTYEVNFHLHPDVRIEKRGDMCCLAFRKGRLFLKPMAPIDSVRLRRGDKREPLGWYSPNYGIKQETYVISYLSAGFPHEIRFDTLIYVDGEQNRHIQ